MPTVRAEYSRPTSVNTGVEHWDQTTADRRCNPGEAAQNQHPNCLTVPEQSDDGPGGVSDHCARGDDAEAAGQHVDAIRLYTQALLQDEKCVAVREAPSIFGAFALRRVTAESATQVLVKRATAMVRLSLQQRAAPQAERATPGLPDAQTLAKLALRDADKAISLQCDSVAAYVWKGRALCALAEYYDATEAVQTGLNFNLNHPELVQELKQAQSALADHEARSRVAVPPPAATTIGANAAAAVSAAATPTVWSRNEDGPANKRPRTLSASASPADAVTAAGDEEVDDDFSCPLCCKLLFEPVTTPCGHTFCRDCLMRSLDHATRCPLCRTMLHASSASTHAISASLARMLAHRFPSHTRDRQTEAREDVNHGPSMLPLFVIDFVLPGQTVALNVFEPRYRLMVRRCLEGDRRFGMLGGAMPVGDAELGCEVEIQDSRQLHDGRYHVQVKALRRFWILRKWDLDGYRVARVDFFSDSMPSSSLRRRIGGAVKGGALLNEPPDPRMLARCTSSFTSDASSTLAAATSPPLNTATDTDIKPSSGDSPARIRQQTRQLQLMVKEWLVRAKTLSSCSPKMALLFRQLVARAGKMPNLPAADMELYTFWVGNILPTSARDRQELLATTTTEGRILVLLRHMRETIEQTRTVMGEPQQPIDNLPAGSSTSAQE